MCRSLLKKTLAMGPLQLLSVYLVIFVTVKVSANDVCPPENEILPCLCKSRGNEVLLSCRRSSLEELSLVLAIVARRVPHVTELLLEDNYLPEIPSRFFGLLSIRRILLWGNTIERVSHQFLAGLESSLQELHIREIRLKDLPDSALEQMHNLERLVIENSPIQEFPRVSGLQKMTNLLIDGSQIADIPSNILRSMRSLRYFHLTHSALSRLEADTLTRMEQLSVANLSNNAIHYIHPRAFHQLPALLEMDLRSNQIRDLSTAIQAFAELRNLQTLTLERNVINELRERTFTNMMSLKVLGLSHNRVTHLERATFQNLPVLQTVDLSYNLLNVFPYDSFVNTPSVEELSFAGNHIGNLAEVSQVTSALPRLRILNLNHCGISSISSNAFTIHPSLERIYLRNNSMLNIAPNAFQRLPVLTELDLSRNKLSNGPRDPRFSNADYPSNMGGLNGAFWSLPSLKILDLSLNELQAMDKNMLVNLPSLKLLNVSGNHIARIEARTFAEAPSLEILDLSVNKVVFLEQSNFRHLDRLRRLDLQGNNIHQLDANVFVDLHDLEHLNLGSNELLRLNSDAFPYKNGLRYLDLSDNLLSELNYNSLTSLRMLKSFLAARNRISILDDRIFEGKRDLEVVDLSGNDISKLPSRLFTNLIVVRDVNLAMNSINVVYQTTFNRLESLQKLNLSHNQITELEGEVFVDTKNLRSLDLSHNSLTDLTTHSLNLPSLQVFDLQHNQIKDLADFSLGNLPSLSELRLGYNHIASVPARVFSDSWSLIKLGLGHNQIQELSRGAFARLHNLQALQLQQNQLSSIPSEAFSELRSLETLEMQENRISRMAADAFTGPVMLQKMNVSHNQFDTLSGLGMDGLASLEVLDISYNQVTELDDRSLRRLNRLVELRMDNNVLCRITDGAFNAQQRMQVLRLRNNKLRILRESTFSRMQVEMQELDVQGNPLQCDCHLIWLQKWALAREGRNVSGTARSVGSLPNAKPIRRPGMRSAPGNRKRNARNHLKARSSKTLSDSGIVCAFPPELQGTPLTNLRPSRLACDANARAMTDEELCSEFSFRPLSSGVQQVFLDFPSSSQTPDLASISPSTSPSSQPPPLLEDDYEDYYDNSPDLNLASSGSSVLTAPVVSTTEAPEIEVEVAKVGGDYTPGDTPTLYAGIRKQGVNLTEETKQAASAPSSSGLSLFGISLPDLRFGLNLLPALIGAGTGALAGAEILNSNRNDVSNKRNQFEHANNHPNSNQNTKQRPSFGFNRPNGPKPMRGPDAQDQWGQASNFRPQVNKNLPSFLAPPLPERDVFPGEDLPGLPRKPISPSEEVFMFPAPDQPYIPLQSDSNKAGGGQVHFPGQNFPSIETTGFKPLRNPPVHGNDQIAAESGVKQPDLFENGPEPIPETNSDIDTDSGWVPNHGIQGSHITSESSVQSHPQPESSSSAPGPVLENDTRIYGHETLIEHESSPQDEEKEPAPSNYYPYHEKDIIEEHYDVQSSSTTESTSSIAYTAPTSTETAEIPSPKSPPAFPPHLHMPNDDYEDYYDVQNQKTSTTPPSLHASTASAQHSFNEPDQDEKEDEDQPVDYDEDFPIGFSHDSVPDSQYKSLESSSTTTSTSTESIDELVQHDEEEHQEEDGDGESDKTHETEDPSFLSNFWGLLGSSRNQASREKDTEKITTTSTNTPTPSLLLATLSNTQSVNAISPTLSPIVPPRFPNPSSNEPPRIILEEDYEDLIEEDESANGFAIEGKSNFPFGAPSHNFPTRVAAPSSKSNVLPSQEETDTEEKEWYYRDYHKQHLEPFIGPGGPNNNANTLLSSTLITVIGLSAVVRYLALQI